MRALRQFGNFILFSNLFVSVCAAAMTAQTYLLLHIRLNPAYVAFVFFSTLFLYSLQRVVLSPIYSKTIGSDRHNWIIDQQKTLRLIYSLAGIGMIVCLYFIGTTLLYIMIPLGILSVSYFLPAIGLRNLPAIKALMVSVVWAVVSVYAPLQLNGGAHFNSELLFMFSERTLFVLSLCIVFNIRDIEHDKLSGVRTIPSLYGIKTGKVSALICLAAALLFTVFLYRHENYSMTSTLALAVSFIVTGFTILRCNEKRGEWYYLFAIDGMMLLQTLLIGACNFI